MNRFRGVRRVLRLGAAPAELEEELAFHFDRSVEELMAAGRSRQQAEEEARRRFGDERHWRRELGRIDRGAAVRQAWSERIHTAVEALRHALRRIIRSPGLTSAVVLTFGLGIGANATMFAIVDRLLLSPPAHVAEAEEVQRLLPRSMLPTGPQIGSVLSYPNYRDLTAGRSFSVAAYSTRTLTIGRGEQAREVSATLATSAFYPLLGVQPALGRFYTPGEDRVGAAPVAVLGHALWRGAFAGDPGVIGRTLDFGYGPATIIGVAPPGFTGVDLQRVDLWLPLSTVQGLIISNWEHSRNWYWLRPIIRVEAGASAATAAAEATALVRHGEEAAGIDASNLDLIATPLLVARGPEAPPEAAVARWLTGLSLLVLLIACANVANLLLAHTIRRQREVGIRLALGSSRGRVLGQVLAESLLLALLGGAAALLVARLGGGLLRATLLPDVDWQSTGLEYRVGALVLILSVVAGVTAGAIPALQAIRPRLAETLKSGGRGVAGGRGRTRKLLTIVQAAVSVVLLIGAGLFVRSLQQVRSVDMGFEAESLLLFNPVFERGVDEPRRVEILRQARERLLQLPVVTHASGDITVPFQSIQGTGLRIPGVDSIPGSTAIHVVDAGYFSGMGLRVLRGREITEDDVRGSPRVAVVNQTMADRLWPGEDPLGRCLQVGADEVNAEGFPCSAVVGVVENSRSFELVEDPSMHYYVPAAQEQLLSVPEAMLIRVRGEAEEAIGPVQRVLWSIDPSLRHARVQPLQELVDPLARSWRLGATMFTVFGVLALLVAAIGLYSVLAFAVLERTQELGVRAALGAGRERLLRMIIMSGLRLVGVGVGLGLLVAALAASRIEPLLFQVAPRDPLVLSGAAAVFLLVGLLASLVPALRATRVDPSVALRAD